MLSSNQKSGLNRLLMEKRYKPTTYTLSITDKKKAEPSEDTKIRKDIYSIITNMIEQNKSDIEIEIFLSRKYPNYAEYIPKVINDQFVKRKLKKSKDTEIGDDER